MARRLQRRKVKGGYVRYGPFRSEQDLLENMPNRKKALIMGYGKDRSYNQKGKVYRNLSSWSDPSGLFGQVQNRTSPKSFMHQKFAQNYETLDVEKLYIFYPEE